MEVQYDSWLILDARGLAMEPIETSPIQKDGSLAQLRNETYFELCLSCLVNSKILRTERVLKSKSPSYIALFSQGNGSNCLHIAYLSDAIQAKACSRREIWDARLAESLL